ncbi:MAG: GNAT family N-acetyltransferase, partial [bacterium]
REGFWVGRSGAQPGQEAGLVPAASRPAVNYIMPDPAQSPRAVVSLRKAREGDALLLSQLGARLFEQAFGSANDPEDMRAHLARVFSVEAQRAELNDGDRAIWIAEDAGRAAVGYAMLRRGITVDGVAGEKPAEVQRIYVERAWHGQGVGEALMRACVEHATNVWHADVIWLGVWEKNPRAIAFYEKAGFHIVGRQTFVLGSDVQQDFVMARPLR